MSETADSKSSEESSEAEQPKAEEEKRAPERPEYPPSEIDEPPNRRFQTILRKALDEVELSITPTAFDHCTCIFEMLSEANSVMNLVADPSPEEVAVKHIADSLLMLKTPALDGLEIRRAVDVGTGAGFPGMVLAVANPAIEWTLIESTGKKARFLEDVVFSLGLENVMITTSRAEALAQNVVHREEYQLVVARAVGSAPVLCELGLPFLKIGGRLVLYKGPDGPSEIPEAERAAGECGGTSKGHVEAKLPILGHDRTYLIWEKTSPTPRQYPRREGIPEKNPLK